MFAHYNIAVIHVVFILTVSFSVTLGSGLLSAPGSVLSVSDSFNSLRQRALSHGFQLRSSQPADFNHTYTNQTTNGLTISYAFKYNVSREHVTAVRITSVSQEADADFPVLFVVREERSVISWQIPLILHYTYQYLDVSRTLCPMDSNLVAPLHTDQTIYVDVSSQANTSKTFTLRAEIIQDFIITDKKFVKSSPSNPVYYLFKFPKDVDSVLIRATSKDKKCAVLSIQDIKCPVFDLDTDVEYQGKYQTMTTQGAIMVNREDYSQSSFYIVIVVKPNDIDCTNGINEIHPVSVTNAREKNFTITVREAIPSTQYYKGILFAVGVFVAFYLAALIIGIYYHGCNENWGIIDIPTFERSMSQEDSASRPIASRGRGYGAIANPAAAQGPSRAPSSRELGDVVGNSDSQDSSGAQGGARGNDDDDGDDGDQVSINSEEYDLVRDADNDKNIFRTKTALYVCDLARKSEKRADKAYRLYAKNLFTIAIFYGLPVVQLVMTYQQVLNITGNQDICYYNFACAHPLGHVSAFNNIFSNIGYVLLGILFIILVKRRSYLHKRAVERSEGRHKLFGIPQHFGLFYAMGMALVMEGVMSACYHVCPTVSNFQFDTSFMYIMGCLCILKIYQNRHPDISAKAHSSYLVMALIIIVAVIGVVYGTNIFWILFAMVYMTASLVLSLHLYYMGRWQLDRYICKRMFHLIISDWLKCSKPVYPNRMVLLIIGNIVNWSLALYGALKPNKGDFASHLLAIFIGNLLLYTAFYIISKKLAKEKIPTLTVILILLAMVTWGFALYFFVAHLTSWQLTPAGSREGNKECILLQFYDKHDVWHFLSSISLFFSFLVLLTLDDEIILKRRDQIPVF